MILACSKRRALSAVITTAILLSAVATIGTAVVAWSNTNSRSYTAILVNSSANNINKINETPKIENIVLIPAILAPPVLKAINITVSNVGTEGFNVTQIVVSDTSPQSMTKTVKTTCTLPPNAGYNCSTKGAINPQSSGWFWYTYNWQSNLPVTIQITTARGTVITTQAMHS